MQRLQTAEHVARQLGDLAGVAQRDTVVLGHIFRRFSLFEGKLRGFLADAAGREVGDDAVPQSGGGIVQGRHLEAGENMQENRGAGNNNLRPPGPDADDLLPLRDIHAANVAVKFADLRRCGALPVRLFPARTGDGVGGAHDSRSGGRSPDDFIDLDLTHMAKRRLDFLVDILFHPVDFVRARRVRLQEHFREAQRP